MAIGSGWAEGAWVDAGWVTGAWAAAGVDLPVITSVTIPTDGSSAVIAFDESVEFGVGGSDDFTFTMDHGAVTFTYDAGEGTASLSYTPSRVIYSYETGTYTYTQPGDGIIATDDGAELATVGPVAVTNNSTVVAPPCDNFTFNDQTGVALSAANVESGDITLNNVVGTPAVTFSGDASLEWSKNSGVWSTGATTAADGDTFNLRLDASASYSTEVSGTMTVGGSVADTYSVTTAGDPSNSGVAPFSIHIGF